jgi:hypothetical protein
MENQPSTDSTVDVEKEKTYQDLNYWGCFLFGPYYVAYKGFLKRAVQLGFINVIILTIFVDYIIHTRNEALENILYMITSLGINFCIAYKWDEYIIGKGAKPNSRYPFTNITITILSILFSIILVQIVESTFYELRLNNAKDLDKMGRENEAFQIYHSLCASDFSDGCFSAGLSLATLELHEKSAKYFSKGCKLDHGEACYILGLYFKNKDDKKSVKLISKACNLGHEEACK